LRRSREARKIRGLLSRQGLGPSPMLSSSTARPVWAICRSGGRLGTNSIESKPGAGQAVRPPLNAPELNDYGKRRQALQVRKFLRWAGTATKTSCGQYFQGLEPQATTISASLSLPGALCVTGDSDIGPYWAESSAFGIGRKPGSCRGMLQTRLAGWRSRNVYN
jgi:hypothetical protein